MMFDYITAISNENVHWRTVSQNGDKWEINRTIGT